MIKVNNKGLVVTLWKAWLGYAPDVAKDNPDPTVWENVDTSSKKYVALAG